MLKGLKSEEMNIDARRPIQRFNDSTFLTIQPAARSAAAFLPRQLVN
jgi:hypothetical protein